MKCFYIYIVAVAVIVLICSYKALKFSKLYKIIIVFLKSFLTLMSYEVIKAEHHG